MAVTLTESVLRRMGLPRDLWTSKVPAIQDVAARDAVIGWLRNIDRMFADGVGMLLFGGPGVGKSAVASILARAARERGKTVYFTTVWELRQAIWNKEPFDSERTVFERARGVDLLVLDDLVVTDSTERVFGLKDLRALIGSRAAEKRVTVLTTQMTPGQLDDGFPGLMGVVKGCMLGIEVAGKDLREARQQSLADAVLAE